MNEAYLLSGSDIHQVSRWGGGLNDVGCCRDIAVEHEAGDSRWMEERRRRDSADSADSRVYAAAWRGCYVSLAASRSSGAQAGSFAACTDANRFRRDPNLEGLPSASVAPLLRNIVDLYWIFNDIREFKAAPVYRQYIQSR